jgi:type II secretory pathway pseudopilin PulG
MQFKHNSSGFTLIEIILVVVAIFILATIAVPASTAFRHKAAISAAGETAKTIQMALTNYASANSKDAYPSTHEAANWPAFRAICSAHGAVLAETLILQGLSFFQYHGVNSQGKSCDNSEPETACSHYYIIMRALNVHGDREGSQIVITESGIQRQTY